MHDIGLTMLVIYTWCLLIMQQGDGVGKVRRDSFFQILCSFRHSRSTASSYVDKSNGSRKMCRHRDIVITKSLQLPIFRSRDCGNGQARNVNNQNGILRGITFCPALTNNAQ